VSRRAVGTPVFGGMLAASVFGILLIPMLYVVFQWLRERVGRTRALETTAAREPDRPAAGRADEGAPAE
jgi:hypothetical protein